MFHQGENIQKTIKKSAPIICFRKIQKNVRMFIFYLFLNLIYFPVTAVIPQITCCNNGELFVHVFMV